MFNKPKYKPSHKKHHHHHHHKKDMVRASVQHEVPNTPKKPEVINDNPYVKVPVVLGETTLQIDLDAMIDFPETVLEIKKIKKNLKLVQCRLLLPTNKLFIKGFVRKNIQYATPIKGKGNDEYISSKLRSLTVDVPFQAVTQIDFINKPDFKANPDDHEFRYFNSQPLPEGFPDKENLLAGDMSQFNQISKEIFNELPYCELLSSKFVEYDEALNRKMGRVLTDCGDEMDAPFEEGTFTELEEKMVIELTLKVLQNQQVLINGKKDCDHDHDHGHKDDHHRRH